MLGSRAPRSDGWTCGRVVACGGGAAGVWCHAAAPRARARNACTARTSNAPAPKPQALRAKPWTPNPATPSGVCGEALPNWRLSVHALDPETPSAKPQALTPGTPHPALHPHPPRTGVCDEELSNCYCPGPGPLGRLEAPPGAPPGTPPLQRGRPIGDVCKPSKVGAPPPCLPLAWGAPAPCTTTTNTQSTGRPNSTAVCALVVRTHPPPPLPPGPVPSPHPAPLRPMAQWPPPFHPIAAPQRATDKKTGWLYMHWASHANT